MTAIKGESPKKKPEPEDRPSGALLSTVQGHAELFVDDLIEFGKDQIVRVTVEVEFGNGTSLSYNRDDFSEIVFGDTEDED